MTTSDDLARHHMRPSRWACEAMNMMRERDPLASLRALHARHEEDARYWRASEAEDLALGYLRSAVRCCIRAERAEHKAAALQVTIAARSGAALVMA